MRAETVYLMVRVAVLTDYENISHTVNDIETKAKFLINSTKKVGIVETEILVTRVHNSKKNINNGGAQS